MRRDSSNLTGDFISMQTRFIYIGGAPKQNTIYRSIRKNFIGCLRNVSNFQLNLNKLIFRVIVLFKRPLIKAM